MKISPFSTIGKKYDLDVLILFGSNSKGFSNHLSDLDLAFYRPKNFSFEEETRLWEDLMKLSRRADIDLINIKKTPNALLRYEIFMNGQPLHEKKPGLFAKMRWDAYIDYEDFKRFYKQKSKLIDEQLETLLNK